MKSKYTFIILIGSVLVSSLAFTFLKPTPIYFQIPKGWPKPNYDFSKNPLTEESLGPKPWDAYLTKVDLKNGLYGDYVFYKM
jgi:hypothetical protein